MKSAGPFVVAVAELLRHPGVRREIDVRAPLEDVGISSAQVLEGSEIAIHATVEAMTDHSLTVNGAITADWMGECRRCLSTVEGTLETQVQEVYDVHPVEGETYELDGDRIDLEPMVRDAVLLALPLAPLCQEACAGPEPEHHPLAAAEDEPPRDDRWAALEELKFD